jgi:hypothetical protein
VRCWRAAGPDPAPDDFLAQAFVGGWSLRGPTEGHPARGVAGDTRSIRLGADPGIRVLRTTCPLRDAEASRDPTRRIRCEAGFKGKLLRLTTAEPDQIGMLLTDGRTEWYHPRHSARGAVVPDAMADPGARH